MRLASENSSAKPLVAERLKTDRQKPPLKPKSLSDSKIRAALLIYQAQAIMRLASENSSAKPLVAERLKTDRQKPPLKPKSLSDSKIRAALLIYQDFQWQEDIPCSVFLKSAVAGSSTILLMPFILKKQEDNYEAIAIYSTPFNAFYEIAFQVTLIAQGDVPLSIVMTVCTTLGAAALTPLLTKILAGTFDPVDATKLSMSTMHVVVALILLGSYMQSAFPAVVKIVIPFAPLFAVLAASLLACSVFSENVVRLKASMVAVTLPAELSLMAHAETVLSGEVGVVILSMLLVHIAGFFVGYISAAVCGFREAQRRAISIDVGMQNSSLGVVLATSHFTSPMVALPAAVIVNIMGSSLAFFWRYVDPSDSKGDSYS
ncbi:probable sodium/metabolite cotransporter BASS2, chloroplastic [Prunus avium]|uniref:Probable sodium/metabolite cotransporter BASS2, chloroplastic n=1 Tax=Prunus avium TaxID=42229 RepID=A0A6P5TZV8_PRUAV|nr:probable sodium/metabolite cotransporter BASS2, chloroplastic [Prunus avium]